MVNPREIFEAEQHVDMKLTSSPQTVFGTEKHNCIGAVISPGFVTLQVYANNSILFGRWSFISEL